MDIGHLPRAGGVRHASDAESPFDAHESALRLGKLRGQAGIRLEEAFEPLFPVVHGHVVGGDFPIVHGPPFSPCLVSRGDPSGDSDGHLGDQLVELDGRLQSVMGGRVAGLAATGVTHQSSAVSTGPCEMA
jgi:hypothetical protein